MKGRIAVIVSALIAFSLSSCNANDQIGDLTEFEDQVSYMVGRDIGQSLKDLNTDFNMDILIAAVKEVLADQPSQLPDSVLAQVGARFSQELQAKQTAERNKQLEENKKEGEAFLEENKENPDVITTESGLQYKILEEGDGAKPTSEDRVKVHYHGTLIDGTVFDSSRDRGEPATFPVTGVIKGWTEALQLMNTGSKFKIFVPSELAYGERGARPPVGPNTTLIFEIELLEIVE
ncbi:FKBP-type peptidyl-prolyl cis-trans isomerase [Chitinispirillales bacterium ANBcel5]|uniref:FKBP-type peptidyl-prolyl cis-trans isomerase n=1 Tax=Cellulosispirillum alkaliphilum TaxID=3039283 RepID=UPI002A56ECB0|nr:FKBP-type peptidyl-prolyl cis-trans isomerase [Chitinispirillales bacterium ANBcel5]